MLVTLEGMGETGFGLEMDFIVACRELVGKLIKAIMQVKGKY